MKNRTRARLRCTDIFILCLVFFVHPNLARLGTMIVHWNAGKVCWLIKALVSNNRSTHVQIKFSINMHTPAMAWASRVLPQPGGPWRRNPLGGVTPRVRNTSGCLMWTSSLQTCSTVSSQPPMSENLTEDWAGSKSTNRTDCASSLTSYILYCSK